ncbi:MAG: hypothetical protein OEW11_09655 [Nitrospirota bacterium]|nr:hypothetical protein [Nitrospirota bacterium]
MYPDIWYGLENAAYAALGAMAGVTIMAAAWIIGLWLVHLVEERHVAQGGRR